MSNAAYLYSLNGEGGGGGDTPPGPGGDPAFAPRLRKVVCENLVRITLHEKYAQDPTPFVGYYVAFFANAYLGIITRWVETGMRESSQEMALIAQRLLFIQPGESIEL